MSLPLLEAMLPRKAAAKALESEPLRLAFIYMPNGVRLSSWVPQNTGPDYDLSPSLRPLAPVRDHVLVLSGMHRVFAPGVDAHAQAGSCWLTTSPADERLDDGYPTNKTVDQVAASVLGKTAPFPSLELSCNDFKDNRETKYYEKISWYAPGHAADAETDPRAVWNRLFGEQKTQTRSLLDLVADDARRLTRHLGRADQHKLDEYQTAVFAMEQQMERLSKARRTQKVAVHGPAAIPTERGDYMRLMGDLLALAFETDLSRVATVLFDPERWNSPRTYQGFLDGSHNHHPLSHGVSTGNWDSSMESLGKIDAFHVSVYAHIIKTLAERRGPDGVSLLDRSAIVLGSGMGHGHVHSFADLPIVVAGRLGGRLLPGQHLRLPSDTPLANFWLTLLNQAGCAVQRVADSTGTLPITRAA
ncbi:MAG: DUF1552 domain-containing protein [Deltaproteobacteria bacterium]|nr:DUF1552 domain-containing protein [Deltaproteobacteria bacterium]